MSRLGDVLVKLGPVANDYVVTPGLSSDMRWIRAEDLNALRDELIELRAAAAPPPTQCKAETRSWDHFTPEQMDSYWIRCTLQGPHGEHKDENTGLTWNEQARPNTGSNAGGAQ